MIFGIGTDLLDQTRVAKILQTPQRERFIHKILTSVEQTEFALCSDNKRVNFLAKHFTAKEACSKALGTGIGNNLSFQDMILRHHPKGQPYMELTTRILQSFSTPCKVLVSLTDEFPYVQAMVVIELV